MKKVFITGITGFVGSHLADYILENRPDVEIYGLKRWRSPMDNIRHVEDRIHLVDGDLRDMVSIQKIIGTILPDLIFHLAAQSLVPYSYSVPTDTLMTNVIGTSNLLEAVRIIKGHGDYYNPWILICGSPEEYGRCETAMTEDTPLNPVSPYAVSKVAETRLGYMYWEAYGMNTVISRAFAHEGPRRDPYFAVSSFARQIARVEKGLQPPEILSGNLDSIRTYMDVRDTVIAYWSLLQKGRPGETYNIAGDEVMSLEEVLRSLVDISNIEFPQIKMDSSLLRPADVTRQLADDSKFRQLTTWSPQFSFLGQTLPDMLDYWRERV
ncbi:MAG: GDP-mannose 4,6-dehydratase [Dehalococcoidales bacterium]|nr:GDP-mannose 4,6-dehydratase [Dehalococcoidales bacterium]